jgi:rRNA maturation endonuclease Nob1
MTSNLTMKTITEDKPRLTNDEINAYLGSQNTNVMETILEVDTDINVVENSLSNNSFIGISTKKTTTLETDDALVKYNLTESNFKGDVKVSEVDSELVIEVPEGNTHIGEFMNDLPDNVMFNKVTTGSGMTTLALTNDVKYVIAVPYVTLLLNKEVWCANKSIDALFVHAKGHTEEDIYSYTGNKIMVTYDSLHKVTSILKESRDISEWKLFIDESHRLLQITNFRHKAVNTVLNNFKEYDRYVFGTATPVLDKYKLTETINIKKCRLQWADLEEVKIKYVEAKEGASINQISTTILKDHYTGKTEGNAHVFVNSVQMIVQIFKSIKRFNIKTTDIRVVCAESDYNTKTLAKEGLAIGTVDSDLRGINFYTSTAFEGCDISDTNGKSYVVVDADREHTAIDIYTTLPQIIGRIRDTKYKNECTLIVDPSNKFFTTLEEFEEGIREQISKGRNIVKTYDNSEDNVKEWLLEKIEDSNYVIYDADTNTLRSNENAHLSDMNSFETKSNPLYVSSKTNSLLGKHINNSIVTNYIESKVVIDEILHLLPSGKGNNSVNTEKTLKAFCKKYSEAKTELEALKVVDEYTQVHDFVSEAHKIGVDRIKALGYKKKAIQSELDFTDPCTKHNRELKLLNTLKLKAGQWYSSKVLKARIQKIYDQQGVKPKANIKHLSGIYDMKPKRRQVKGVRTEGIIITSIKQRVNK